MTLNVQKIDQRIKKLQELRRLATDPEIAALLLELITPEEQGDGALPAANGDGADGQAHSGATAELIHEALTPETQPSSGLWGIRRR
jgi:hypothetical protein